MSWEIFAAGEERAERRLAGSLVHGDEGAKRGVDIAEVVGDLAEEVVADRLVDGLVGDRAREIVGFLELAGAAKRHGPQIIHLGAGKAVLPRLL